MTSRGPSEAPTRQPGLALLPGAGGGRKAGKGWLCPTLGDPLGWTWNPSMCLTWKTVCVLSENVGTGNRFSTVRWKGQGDLGNPEYHVFPGAGLTDGRSAGPSGSEPFWATRSASHRSRAGVRAPGALSLADALRAWRPLDLVTQVSWEPVTRGPTLPNFFTGWTLESRAYLQACARVHACARIRAHTHTHTQPICVHACTHTHSPSACTHTHAHTHSPSGALNPVSPFLHSQTFPSASISSSRNPAAPPDPRSSP